MGPELTAENASRGEPPNSDNGLTPVTFEGPKGKERRKEERGEKEEEEISRAYTCSLLRVSGNLKRKGR